MQKFNIVFLALILSATSVVEEQTNQFNMDSSAPIVTALNGDTVVAIFGPVKLNFVSGWKFDLDRGVSVGRGPGDGTAFITVAVASEPTIESGVITSARIAEKKAELITRAKEMCKETVSSSVEELVTSGDKRIYVMGCQNEPPGIGPVYGVYYVILSKLGIVRLSASGRGFGREIFDKVAMSHSW